MHNAGFAALGLNAAYLPLETADVEDFVTFGKAMKLRGASVTAPHKVSMLDRVDELDSLARRTGALNTVVVRNGRWFGSNTDVEGFLAPLSGRMALKGTRATVLGAGGAARAVAVALAHQGATVTIAARNAEAAAAVARIAGGQVGPLPPRPGSWDVLVNATPCGSDANPVNPMAGTRLDGEIVFDLIYSPSETALIKDARESGCMTIGGIEMLVAQAERQFQLWTGQRPPSGLFRAAADTALGASGAHHLSREEQA
jgi:shikimate dehydrogenase